MHRRLSWIAALPVVCLIVMSHVHADTSCTAWQKARYELPVCVPSSTIRFGCSVSVNQAAKGMCPTHAGGGDTRLGGLEANQPKPMDVVASGNELTARRSIHEGRAQWVNRNARTAREDSFDNRDRV